MTGVRNLVLEELIAAEPENDSVKLVYGDWLLARESPWGELIAEQHAKPEPERPLFEWDDPAGITASVRQRPIDNTLYEASIGALGASEPFEENLGDAARAYRRDVESEIFPPESQPTVHWRCGFIDKVFLPQYVGFRDELEKTLIRLLEHPVAISLRELVLGEIEWRSGTGGHRGLHYRDEIDVLAIAAPQSLRRLVFGAWSEHDISWTEIGDVSLLYPELPGLEVLELQAGRIELGELSLPSLRKLLIRSGGLALEAIDSVRYADCPALESLTLWFGQDDYGGTDDPGVTDVFLAGKRFPRLRELGLANAEFTDELCDRLVIAPVLPKLRRLDLSLGSMSDQGARVILDHQAQFKHLEHLDLRGNALATDTTEELERTFESVDVRFQSPSRRYASVGE